MHFQKLVCITIALLIGVSSAEALPLLCQNKKTGKVTNRSSCLRGERQIVNLSNVGKHMFMGRGLDQLGPGGAIQYLAPSGAATPAGQPSTVQMPVSVDCTVIRLVVNLDAAPGSGETRDFIFVVNGVSEGTTCRISDSSTTCNAEFSKALNEGDTVAIESFPSLNPARANVNYSWLCQE